ASPASASFSSDQRACRAAVSKSGDKYAKGDLKAMTGCHKKRDNDGSMAGTNCNDLTAADSAGKVPKAAVKFDSSVSAKCTGVTPSDVDYSACPSPCNTTVPTISTFADVVDCLVCLTDGHTGG